MTTDRDTTRIVRSWLGTGEHESADHVLDAVLDQLDTTPQRRATWWPARRFLDMNNTVRYAIAAAVVAVVAVAALSYGLMQTGTIGQGPSQPSPSQASSPSQPSPSAGQTAIAHFPSFPGAPRPVEAGIYQLPPGWLDPLNDVPVSISFVVPAGWLSCTNNAGLLCLDGGVADVNIDIVTNVVADPCRTALRDPSVGPTVDDLVTAVSSLPWSAITPPIDVTVDGFRGKEFDVTAPASSPCAGDAFAVWRTAINRMHEIFPGDGNRLRILDVQGTRVVIVGSYRPGITSSRVLAEINAIIDSVRIEPLDD